MFCRVIKRSYFAKSGFFYLVVAEFENYTSPNVNTFYKFWLSLKNYTRPKLGMEKLVGRKEEQDIFVRVLKSGKAELVAGLVIPIYKFSV